MQKFMDFLEEKLTPFANKIAANKYLAAISNGFSIIMPMLMMGAIFSLLVGMQIAPYQAFIQSSGIAKYLAILPSVTTDLLSLYAVFAIAYSFTSKNGLPNDGLISGFLALVAFLIITPLHAVASPYGVSNFLPFSYCGAQGLISAIIVGLLASNIYCFIVKKDFTIKLPDSVPPTIAKSFSALIPGFVIGIVFVLINAFFMNVMGACFSDWLYGLIKTPLASLSGSIYTFLLLGVLTSLFWFFGLHGAMITMPFSIMLFTQAAVENQTAFMNGQPLPNIITSTFIMVVFFGGIGATLSLAFIMCFMAKSKRYRTLGKLALAPGICGINEPIMFGFPIILNPIMAIPFFLVPIFNSISLYFIMKMGLLSYPVMASAAMGTPVFLDGYLVTGGDFRVFIVQIVLLIINGLIYYPFFKIQDNIAYKEEQA